MDNEKRYDELHIINFGNYTPPDLQVIMGKKYTLYGEQNRGFLNIKERYNGSTTNAGIINSYVKYIIGDGLKDRKGININKYISKRDIKLICQDFKMYGQYSVQVIWSKGSELLKETPKPIQIKYIPTGKVGLSLDNNGDINGYYFCGDWANQSKFKPKFYSKFDGVFDEETPLQLLTIPRITDEPYFPHPDYYSGLQYAHIEEELSNSAFNHIMNGFSAGKIINCFGGIPATEELKQEYTRKIKEKLTGSSNKNKWFVNFVDSTDGSNGGIKIENIENTSMDEFVSFYSTEARERLFMAHSITSPLLMGVRDGSGLGSNKDEMDNALKLLYRNNINPMREEIIDGLANILKYVEPQIDLYFKDFKELQTKNDDVSNG